MLEQFMPIHLDVTNYKNVKFCLLSVFKRDSVACTFAKGYPQILVEGDYLMIINADLEINEQAAETLITTATLRGIKIEEMWHVMADGIENLVIIGSPTSPVIGVGQAPSQKNQQH